MPELPADFDLKLMPDWLKEPASKNPYADYEGRDEDRRPRGRDDWGGRGRGDDRRGKPGGGQRPGGPRGDGGGGRRDDRGRKDAPAGRKPDGKDAGGKRPDRPAGGGQDDRRGKPGEQRRTDERGGPERRTEQQTQPANVTIEFFPDEGCSVSIARQVKSTHRAYSLFDLARMFLARPERHRLKITTKSVAEPLYQVGENGPVWLDRASAERAAFPISRQKFYVEVTEQRDAPKGNFSNVARCRANGILLGPTNYHGYQPALRKMYEERFSRRMSFPEFQREIEVVNDPALVEQWKQQASSVTAYRLAPRPPAGNPEPAAKPEGAAAEAEPPAEETASPDAAAEPQGAPEASAAEGAPAEAPPEDAAPAEAATETYEGPLFSSLADVEQHFREHYLPGVIRQASSVHLSGEASRTITDRAIAAAVRQAWEQERGFPGQMMHQLRQQFSRSGLHVFKHRKRMQFVSLIRPSPMEDGSLSASVAEILQLIQGNLNCTRASLAAAVLGADESAVDPARKATLAADLRWLIETGRVIEFSDGRLELPVAPVKNEPAKPEAPAAATAAAATAPAAAAPEAGPAEAPITAEPASVAEAEASQAPEPVDGAIKPEAPIADSALESGYEPAEPIAEIPPSAEQEPGHVMYSTPAEKAAEPEPAAISPESPSAEP
jgi:hypothetical protein